MCMFIWVSIPTLFGAPSILYAIQCCTIPNEFLARSNMSPSLPRMINFQMRRWIFGGRCFRWHEEVDLSFSCNVNVKAGGILLPPGDTQLSWKIMICKNVERFFLGYDLRVLLDFRFFVEPVKILCRQFPILLTKEYIDVYNDEDKRHLCEDAESFLAPLVWTICYCIHEGVDQIRWVWGFSLSSISLSSAWSYIKTSRLTLTHMLKAQVQFVQVPQAHRLSI